MPLPPKGSELRIKIGGEAGFGIKAAGQTLARSFMDAGLEVFDLTEYPSLIRGGHNTYTLRVSPTAISSHVETVDVLIALNRETVDRHLDEMIEGGAVIFDPESTSTEGWLPNTKIRPVPVPLAKFAKEAGGPIMANTVALGAALALVHFPLMFLVDALRAQFAHKAPEIAEQNVAAATVGYGYVAKLAGDFWMAVEPKPGAPKRLLVDGNEAVGLGALAAGIGFYAAYPMTPASSLLHFMAAHDREAGVVVKHTEDEIAAMNMVVGAAFTGTRAMCASAGGGFALMVEALRHGGGERERRGGGRVHAAGTGHRPPYLDRAERPALRAPRGAGRVPPRGARPRRPHRRLRAHLEGVQPRRPAPDAGRHPRRQLPVGQPGDACRTSTSRRSRSTAGSSWPKVTSLTTLRL